jgi:hypothetical protein
MPFDLRQPLFYSESFPYMAGASAFPRVRKHQAPPPANPRTEPQFQHVSRFDLVGGLDRRPLTLHALMSQASLATVRRLMSRETLSHLSSRMVTP